MAGVRPEGVSCRLCPIKSPTTSLTHSPLTSEGDRPDRRPEAAVEAILEAASAVAGDPESYDASQIQVLEGLEAVRKRPGMYIGSTGRARPAPPGLRGRRQLGRRGAGRPRHHIEVTMLADGGIRVVDDGRGIPTDIVASEGKPAIEVVLTVLHAGGKFGGGGYQVSGGLHGVGVSVVNALSSRLDVEVRREGHVYRQSYTRRRTGCAARRWTRRPTSPAPRSRSGPAPTSSTPSTSTSRRCAPGSSRWRSSTRA